MPINPARYGFITNEYRYRVVENATLEAAYEKARELEINTKLDVGLITSLLTDLFGVIGAVRRRFVVEFKGTTEFSINDFTDRTPARFFTAPELGVNALPTIVTRINIDEEADLTTVELWG